MKDSYYMPIEEMLRNENHRFIAERMLGSNQSMSFLNEQYTDLESWKTAAREYIFDRIQYRPQKSIYSGRVITTEDFGEYTQTKLYFSHNGEYEIPAYLLLPKNAKKPCPGAVVLHDHGGQFYWGKEKSVEHKNPHPLLKAHFDKYYGGLPTAAFLAQRGYGVLVTDALLFGERRYPLEENPEFAGRLAHLQKESNEYILAYNKMVFEIEWEFVRLMENAGVSSMGVRLADDIASVGYLAQMPEIDAERICCVGLSMGGFRAAWLNALCDTVKCAVVVGWMAKLGDMMKNRPANFAPMWTIPGLFGRLDYPDVVSLAAPKPLMIMHGRKDGLFTHTQQDGTAVKSGEAAIEIIREAYKKAGCEKNLDVRLYDLPHVFNGEMQTTACGWLDGKLNA